MVAGQVAAFAISSQLMPARLIAIAAGAGFPRDDFLK
jgi:hypothetical protein